MAVSGAHITGLQPTYEELKHEKHNLIAGYHRRLQPTYEELKPGDGGGGRRMTAIVYSLPMRN